MNVAAILDRHAATFGDRAAIVESRRTIGFAELNRAAAAAAEELAHAGVAKGMRALVFSPMSIDLYVTVLGLFRLGAVAVFVDPSAASASLDTCIAHVRPDAFAAVPRAHLLRLTSSAVRAIPIRIGIGGRVPGARFLTCRPSNADRPVEPCSEAHPAIITFTSGTTGGSKGVVRTHGFLRAQHRALVEALGDAPGEIDLTTLPIFLLANLASGITSIIPDADLRRPGGIEPSPVLNQIRCERPTRSVASPAFLEQLAAGAAGTGQRLETLQKVFTGGGPVFPRTLEALAAIAPNAAIVAVYGSTEAEPIASVDWRDLSAADRLAMREGAGLLAGRPVQSIRVRILPDRWGSPYPARTVAEFERDVLDTGRAGEIAVSGDHVVGGYLDGRGNEEAKIVVGGETWHRTGDAGRFDEQGRLWLLGRCSDKVADRSGMVYPLAVECAASELAGVRRSAFLRHRDRRVLVLEAGDTALATRDSLRRRLAWARLEDVILVPRIPVDRRHNAKNDLSALRRILDAAGPAAPATRPESSRTFTPLSGSR